MGLVMQKIYLKQSNCNFVICGLYKILIYDVETIISMQVVIHSKQFTGFTPLSSRIWCVVRLHSLVC